MAQKHTISPQFAKLHDPSTTCRHVTPHQGLRSGALRVPSQSTPSLLPWSAYPTLPRLVIPSLSPLSYTPERQMNRQVLG